MLSGCGGWRLPCCGGWPRLWCGCITRDGRCKATGHLPPGGPALFVANHPNGLLDPLVLRVVIGRPVRFLAKSTSVGQSVRAARHGRFSVSAGLPAARRQRRRARAMSNPHVGGGAACTVALRAAERGDVRAVSRRAGGGRGAGAVPGRDVTLRPRAEAFEVGSGAHRPFGGGAGASWRHAGDGAAPMPMPVVVPVGTHYEDKAVFRSGVHLVIGPPIDLERPPAKVRGQSEGGDRQPHRRNPGAVERAGVAGGDARAAGGNRARGKLDRGGCG